MLWGDAMAFFVVEGNIGAGKSTFLRLMGQQLNAELAFEPHEAWQNIEGENLLDAFYKDGKRWAYTFQTYAFITRVISVEQHARLTQHPFLLVERSVFADRYCFAQNAHEIGLMNDLEWALYKDWFSWFVENRVDKPHGFIYLRTDPRICFERLTKRNRFEEKLVELDYLTLIHNRHESWLVHKKEIAPVIRDVPVLILDCDEDFENNSVLQKELSDRVAEFVSKQTGLSIAETRS